jgi:putative aminopeptidase FrvX
MRCCFNPQALAIPDLLHALLTASGPSGHEDAAAGVWREAAAGFAEVGSDTLGTSFARVPAGGEATFAIVGHIDEIGLTITHIDPSGLLAFTQLGWAEPEMLLGQRVTIAGREGPVPGVVAGRMVTKRSHSERGALKHEDLHIDIGAAGAEEAATRVSVGSSAVWIGEPLELANHRVVSKAMDDRLGAYVALETARRVAEAGTARVDVVAVASVQEELGHDGARAAGFGLDPQVALAIDVTYATDVPGSDVRTHGAVELGAGVAITLGPVVNRHVSDLLVKIAEEDGIRHALEVYGGRTHTDADDLHSARAGVPTGLLGIPLRYMHSPVETVSLDDLEATIELAVAFALRLGPETTFLR